MIRGWKRRWCDWWLFFLDRIAKLVENRNNVIKRGYKMKIKSEKWVELNVFILRFDGNIEDDYVLKEKDDLIEK